MPVNLLSAADSAELGSLESKETLFSERESLAQELRHIARSSRFHPSIPNEQTAATNGSSEEPGSQTPPDRGSVADVVDFPKRTLEMENSFRALQSWVGVVTSMTDSGFMATVTELGCASEEAVTDFDFEEVSTDDMELIRPGAFFYWSIGYERSSAGVRSRKSQLRFQRRPVWMRERLEAAESKAELWKSQLE